MLPFDPDSYVTSVLAPIAEGASLPDLFARYLLEPEDDDTKAIRRRMAEVRVHWDKLEGRNNAKYSDLLAQLIHEHTSAELVLLSDVERRQAAQRLRSERASEAQRREDHQRQFEQQLTTLLARAGGGLTGRDRRILEESARGLDLDPAAVAARLGSCPVAAEPSDEVLGDSARAQIRRALADYAAAAGSPSRGVSLFHALELTGPQYDPALLRSSWERLNERQRSLNVTHRAKTSMATVLALARLHLIDNDPAVYGATLHLEVCEALRPQAAAAAIADEAIDELEAEQLVRAAQEMGITADEARELVAELARDLAVKLQLGGAVEYVACAHCNRPHAHASAPERCKGCGEPLFRQCHLCGSRCAATDGACSDCGADLATYVQTVKDFNEAQLALDCGRIALAASLVQADAASASDEHRQLGEHIQRRLRQARSEWSAVEREIAARRLFAVVGHLDRLASTAADVPGPTGVMAEERRTEIAARLREVESLLARARAQHGPARERLLAEVLERVSDCREAERELARVAPLPVSEVCTSIEGASIRVSWRASPSPGPVRYRVNRLGDHSGVSVELECTGALSSIDRAPPAGEQVRYGVVSERAGGTSAIVLSPPQVLARAVQDVALYERDGEIQLAWQPVAGNGRVEVERTDEDTGAIVRLQPDGSGLADREVRNGLRYRYRLWVVYSSPNGQLVQSNAVVLHGRPSSPPRPVDDLRAEPDGKLIRLRFSPPPVGTVSVLRCAGHPDVQEGEQLTDEQILQAGEQLPVDAGGVYDPAPSSIAWYLPISRAGDYVLAGRAVRCLALPGITDVRALDLGDDVRVTWSWPAGVRAAMVVWRRDRQPIDAEEPHAERLVVTQAQYEEQGGVELAASGDQPVLLAVFSAASVDGELLASSAADRRARVAVGRSKRVQISYAVRRSGLRRRRICFEIEADGGALPELVIVARQGELLPRSASDGQVIAQLGGLGGPREYGVDLSELGRPIAVRLFLGSTAAQATHRLRDPETRELVFR